MADRLDAIGDASGDQPDARRGEHGQFPPGRVGSNIPQSEFVSDRYNMNHSKRGVAVIINNKIFDSNTRMGERTGSDVDANGMYEILDTLGFEKIMQFDNITVDTMKNRLREASKLDHSQSDCFVCVILSHGEEGYVYGKDGKVSVDDLVIYFKGHNCPSLAGKPKLFFIQACRGTELDRGVEVADAAGEPMEEDLIRRIPTEADFLMAYSVVPGFFAWRNSARGSWFIQAVVEVFKKHWKHLDVLTMMTRVNKKVAYDFESNAAQEFMNCKKQIPCITSMLTKDVYFTEK